MAITFDQHQPFGRTGLLVPPMMFGTAALGNVRRVTAEQTKFEICGQWFQHVVPPIFIDTSAVYGGGLALEMLRRALARYGVAQQEVIVNLRLPLRNGREKEPRGGTESFLRHWHDACRVLGDRYIPQLVSIAGVDDHTTLANLPAERNERPRVFFDAHDALCQLKSRGELRGIGLVANDWRLTKQLVAAADLDWVMLVGSLTIMRHPPELLDFLQLLSARQIPTVLHGVFHCGFLLGGNVCDGRVVDPEDPHDRQLFTWRKAFAALCHGHGVSPTHACIQFALSAPGVVSVAIDTSHPDRIAENAAAVCTQISPSFWQSMREEGLLNDRYPYLG